MPRAERWPAAAHGIEAQRLPPADDRLLQAAALQNAIFNSANFSSIATDARGVIQIFNVGAERMLGYTAAEVLNQITPADISDPEELLERAQSLSLELATLISPGFEALVFKASREIEDIYELTYIRKDGSRCPAMVSVTALRDEQNEIIGYLLIGTDNTARKLVEEEQKILDQRLRDQQFYTRSLIESNIDALMMADPAGIITDVNKQMEALTGCTRDELIGAPFKDFFTDPDRAASAIKLVLRNKKVTDYELTAIDREGRETVVSYNAMTFYDRSRKLQGVFAAARDVTEYKQVEADLKQARAVAESANRAKSDFLANMSHEIRTPMNSIMGVADLLAETKLTAEQAKYVAIFQRSGENLLNLINDILDLSKVEASQLELERTGFSLLDQLDKIAEMVGPRAAEKALALAFDVAENVPTRLIGDPTRLSQVLVNLLGNAIKFTITGSVALAVTLYSDAGATPMLLFTVTDTGIGVPVEKQDGIFERFIQADTSMTRRFGGSGLGLTICREMVELMGGDIWFESEWGKGSAFSIRVPFTLWNTDELPAAEPVKTDFTQLLAPMRILLAEDSPDNCTIILAYLENTPCVVEIGDTGAMACAMFKARPYDLVLMDRQMPVMDGLTATRTIRAWEIEQGRRPTPIIALTASALKGDRELCLAAGCSAFLTKPIKQAVLMRAIWESRTGAQTGTGLDASPATLAVKNPVTASMVAKFLSRCHANLAMMQSGLDQADFAPLAHLGHQLRGAGSMFGFDQLTEIGAGLELAGATADETAAQAWLTVMAACLRDIEAASPGA